MERVNPRAYRVVRGKDRCLDVENRPGTLHSMAGPPMGFEPPRHDFIHAASTNPFTESELRVLLMSVASFDAFLARVVGVGYDVMAVDAGNEDERKAPKRIVDEVGKVLGAVWPMGGQLASLTWQPREGELVFGHAQVTAYEPALVDFFHGALASTSTFEGLVDVFEGSGYRLE